MQVDLVVAARAVRLVRPETKRSGLSRSVVLNWVELGCLLLRSLLLGLVRSGWRIAICDRHLACRREGNGFIYFGSFGVAGDQSRSGWRDGARLGLPVP